MSTQVINQPREPRRFHVTGHVRFADCIPAPMTKVEFLVVKALD